MSVICVENIAPIFTLGHSLIDGHHVLAGAFLGAGGEKEISLGSDDPVLHIRGIAFWATDIDPLDLLGD